MKFDISNPSTCLIQVPKNSPLLVLNQRGQIWHQQTTFRPVVSVKIPFSGTYSTNGKIIEIKEGIKKPAIISLPKKTRNFDDSNFKIIHNPNLKGTPARIFFEKGICEVSTNFQKLPIQWQEFILLHEKGHFKYEEETSADTFALNEFLQKGYNASQAFFALRDVLRKSEENLNRQKEIYKQIETLIK
jgi:hypothetical protein